MEDSTSLIHQTDSEFEESKRRINRAFSKVKKSRTDYLALSFATFGVGYIRLAPGTWGSLVGIGIYLLIRSIGLGGWQIGLASGWRAEQMAAWQTPVNIFIVLLITLAGIWAGGRAAKLMNDKDPQSVVVDEVVGQLITLAFIPFDVVWWMILAGFFLFRFFDIAKPYPIDRLQILPGGLGVCADDILAGLYAAAVLSVIAAIQISFN
ncbi:MAG: phosphatidylglycerophosphatase A [Acidobacteriota bacterium]|nr:phosphatidylglycerophosphatase A [Acidobacteriota bacterium]